MSPRLHEISAKPRWRAPTAACVLALAWAGGVGAALAAEPQPQPQPQPQNLPPGVIAQAEAHAAYPTFASIPPEPNDIPTPDQWKAKVVDTRLAGARLMRQIARMPWSLDGSLAWAVEAKAEATPPPPITTPFSPETAAELAELRARASAPPRSR